VSLLREMIKAPLETFNLADFANLEKVFQDEDFKGTGVAKVPSNVAHPIVWNCRTLIKCLIDMLCIKDTDKVERVADVLAQARTLIDLAAKQAPETLLIGLVQIEVRRLVSQDANS
jgi:hypothetical protein